MTKRRMPDPEETLTADSSGASRRRDFLKVSAAAAGATLLASCVAAAAATRARNRIVGADDPLSRFDYLVVLMFENRSLDNLLGYPYPAGGAVQRPRTAAAIRSPVPPQIKDGHASVWARPSPGTDADMQNPNPDPGERYPHINTQLFGLVDPETNRLDKAGA